MQSEENMERKTLQELLFDMNRLSQIGTQIQAESVAHQLLELLEQPPPDT